MAKKKSKRAWALVVIPDLGLSPEQMEKLKAGLKNAFANTLIRPSVPRIDVDMPIVEMPTLPETAKPRRKR